MYTQDDADALNAANPDQTRAVDSNKGLLQERALAK